MEMSCSISEQSFYKTIPTKLLKLVLMSKSINELQKHASISLISPPVPLQTTLKIFTPLPPKFSHPLTLKPPQKQILVFLFFSSSHLSLNTLKVLGQSTPDKAMYLHSLITTKSASEIVDLNQKEFNCIGSNC